MTGMQIHQGNTWSYPTNINRPGAFNNGVSADMSSFIVDEDENPALSPYDGSPSDWFRIEADPAPTKTCTREGLSGCNVQVFRSALEDPNLKNAIISGNLAFQEYGDLKRWVLKEQLLSEIVYFGHANDPQLQNFWSAEQASSTGIIAQMKANAADFYDDNASLLNAIDQLGVEINSLLRLNDLSSATNQLIIDKVLLLQSLQLNSQIAWQLVLNNLQALNQTMPETTPYEANQKLFQDIYLAYHSLDTPALTAQQILQLEQISTQCVMEGGPVVLQARGWLSAIGEWTDIPMEYDCQPGQPVQKSVMTDFNIAKPTIFLAPNPGAGYSQLHLNASDPSEEYTLEIWDFSGRLVNEQIIERSVTNLRLEAGLYNIRVKSSNGQTVAIEKLVIINP